MTQKANSKSYPVGAHKWTHETQPLSSKAYPECHWAEIMILRLSTIWYVILKQKFLFCQLPPSPESDDELMWNEVQTRRRLDEPRNASIEEKDDSDNGEPDEQDGERGWSSMIP